VIVANRDGVGMHGVAPGATVIVVGTDNSVGGVNADYTIRGYNDLIARGVRIINNSWGQVAAIWAGGIGLTAPGQFASSLVGSVGLRLGREFELGAARVAIEARSRWQREFLDDAVAIDTAFIGASAASFSVSGAQIARDRALVGVGLSASAGRNVTLVADYDVRISTDVTAHAVTGGLRATW
jgi:hypothetical protein